MITCDRCQTKSAAPNFVDDVICNLSLVGRGRAKNRDDKTTATTASMFRGQLCKACFDQTAEEVRVFIRERMKPAGSDE